MAPFREFNSISQQRQRYVKKGRIHSERALKRRAEEWMEKWSSIIGLSKRVFENHSLDETIGNSMDEHSYRSSESLKGFEFQGVHECITVYGMTREQIENLEMEENLTTDEEDDYEEEERSFSPVSLSFEYSAKYKKLKLCSINSNKEVEIGASGASASLSKPSYKNINGNVALSTFAFHNIKFDPALSTLQSDRYVNDETPSPDDTVNDHTPLQSPPDENLSPSENNYSNKDNDDPEEGDGDPDAERTRPISRISLVIHPYGDDGNDNDVSDCETERPVSRMSRSGYMSYYETDYEDEDNDNENNKSILKTRKSGQCVYGKIPGINVGKMWKNRRQFSRRSVHRPQNALIHGGPKGAYSMVLSATCSVDDRGEEFDFFGEGGRDPKTKKHVRDQRMERGNLSLRENIQTGTPVRVIRGYQLQNMFAPEVGYRYDGLYEVTQCTMDRKIDGFKVFMFTFARCGHQPPPPWHTFTLNLPLPSPSSVDHQLTDSDDDLIAENERHKKTNRRKRKKTMVPEICRSSTPLSCISDDIPPELQLPENNVECAIVYPIPPCLSPSLSFNNGFLGIQKRPVLLLEKLDDSITAEAVKKPINVNDIRLLNVVQQSSKKMKSKPDHSMNLLKEKKKYIYNRKKTPAVNDNILKRGRNKIKNVIHVVNTAKKTSAKKVKHSQNKTKHSIEEQFSNQPIKKKPGRPKIKLVTKDDNSRNVAIKKKRGRKKIALINKTKVNKSLGKIVTKKDISVKEEVKKKRGRPKGAINYIKSTNSKKYVVALTQKKATVSKINEKEKIILKKSSHAQGKKTQLPNSYPGKKRGRKRKNSDEGKLGKSHIKK